MPPYPLSLGVAWRRLASLGVAWRRLASLGVAWRRLASLCVAWRRFASLGVAWRRLASLCLLKKQRIRKAGLAGWAASLPPLEKGKVAAAATQALLKVT